MKSAPLDRLRARSADLGGRLCLGIDPHPDQLPEELTHDLRGVETFARGVVGAAAQHAVAIKINVAFFEAFGAAGWAALERVRADVPPDHFLILDAKRGDIGSTAERYAAGLFGQLNADAVTLSPYLGADAIEPFLAYPDRVVYVLGRTSNPSAGTLQDLPVGGDLLYQRVADWVTAHWPEPRVGLVVGATAPGELRALRGRHPEPAFLVPGVGAQGGDLRSAVECCDGLQAPGLVAVSRAISGASRGADWRDAAAESARVLSARMSELGATLAD